MPRKTRDAAEVKTVDPELTAKAIAKAVCDGDIVNLRFLFHTFSPARADSPERFETDKYAYLLPTAREEGTLPFKESLQRVKEPDVWGHCQHELEASHSPQLHADLLLLLADNALQAGRYASAAQAYELLRIRERMQDELLRQADEAFDGGNVAHGVRGYMIASRLAYDYAAFPEPLPALADYQKRALMLHGDYPAQLSDCLAMKEDDAFLDAALSYLVLDPDVAARLKQRPLEQRIAFLKRLVREEDPAWDEFVEAYVEACRVTSDLGERWRPGDRGSGGTGTDLAKEIAGQLADDPMRIPAFLVGRTIEDGEWWQYLKELAYMHPAGALFVVRQLVGDREILLPCHKPDSPVAKELGLTKAPDPFAWAAEDSGAGGD